LYWSVINNVRISGQSLLNSARAFNFLGCYVGSYLRALEKLRKATIAFVTSVCPFVRTEQLEAIGMMVMQYDICIFFKKPSKIQVLLKIDKNNGHVTWRPI